MTNLYDIKEVWKDIEGYEDMYQVSNLGRVKSLKSGKQLSPSGNGYLKVTLSNGVKSKNTTVHRLVALAFLPTPNENHVVNHKDGNKANNRLSNLEWCTRSENNLHAIEIGLVTFNRKPKEQLGLPRNYATTYEQRRSGATNIKKWNDIGGNKKPVVAYMGEEMHIFTSMREAMSQLDISKCALYNALNGISKTSKGYFWRYV